MVPRRRRIRLTPTPAPTTPSAPAAASTSPAPTDPFAWLDEHPRLLTAKEVGGILRLPVKKVYDLDVTAVAISPRRLRWDRETLRNWLLSKRTGTGGLAAYCTSLGLHAAPMTAREVATLLRIRPDEVKSLDIPGLTDDKAPPRWHAYDVAAWLWGHRVERSGDQSA